MSFARDRLYLTQIVDIAAFIRAQLDPMDRDQFMADKDAIDSTAYRLLSIGEASRRLSPELIHRHPEIDWRAIIAMRNVLAHDYVSIGPERLWEVYAAHLTSLAAVCTAELVRLSAP